MNAIVPAPGSPLVPQNLDQAMRLAEMMARGKMVPDHLRNPADALLVIEQAMRWGMSPFAVAQCTSVIQGKLNFEGKLVAAAVQSSGLLSSRLSYDFEGEGAGRAVTVTATIRGEDKPRSIRITLAEAKTTNQFWTKQPDQQLVYSGTRMWARRHAPEVMLGIYSAEEFDAPPPPEDFAGTTIDGNAHSVQLSSDQLSSDIRTEPTEPTEPTELSKGDLRDQINADFPLTPSAPKRTARAWLDELRQRVSACTSRDEFDAIVAGGDVEKAVKHFRNDAARELNEIMADGMAHWVETEHADAPFPGDA